MDYKAKAIELLGNEEDFDHTKSDFVSNNYDALYGYNQMHSKAVEVVEGLLERIDELEELIYAYGRIEE